MGPDRIYGYSDDNGNTWNWQGVTPTAGVIVHSFRDERYAFNRFRAEILEEDRYRRDLQDIFARLDDASELRRFGGFWSKGGSSHSPPPCPLWLAIAPMPAIDPPALSLPRRTPRSRLAARRQLRPVRSRPGARRAA